MGTLITFELKKILGNKAGMVSCALVIALVLAMTVLNAMTMGAWDTSTGTYVEGPQALRVRRAYAESHAGTLSRRRSETGSTYLKMRAPATPKPREVNREMRP